MCGAKTTVPGRYGGCCILVVAYQTMVKKSSKKLSKNLDFIFKLI
jgi:hypothetical protein